MKIKGHDDLVKTESNAIVNTNWKVYEAAKKRKLDAKRLDTMEAKINRIESLLEKLVNG
tara:strand:- start:1362 stop:1538 length:177 start_codon:yes stop_codon:yes gene_type:complete